MPRYRLEIGDLVANGGPGRAEEFARKIFREEAGRPLVVRVVPGEFSACDHVGAQGADGFLSVHFAPGNG